VRLAAKMRSLWTTKPLTELRVQKIADAAAARESLIDLKVAAKSGFAGRIQLEKQLGAIARRPR
jgi:hypothetical protein